MASVLIIDDDSHFRRLASVTLSSRGHTVIEAGRCAEGGRAIAKQKPDLIIMDGLLPDGDGAAWVKSQRAAGLSVPVLFVSAFRKSPREQQALARESGIDSVLGKPISAAELLAKVESTLKKHGGSEDQVEVVLGEGELRALELMRAQYSADLPNLVAGLQAAVKQLAASPRDLAVQGVARRRAHQIAGTAGSFGFAAIGDACAGLEQTIVALQAGGELGPVEAALRALVLADFPELG
jgi:DNA-binding response OmpR family regulator